MFRLHIFLERITTIWVYVEVVIKTNEPSLAHEGKLVSRDLSFNGNKTLQLISNSSKRASLTGVLYNEATQKLSPKRSIQRGELCGEISDLFLSENSI